MFREEYETHGEEQLSAHAAFLIIPNSFRAALTHTDQKHHGGCILKQKGYASPNTVTTFQYAQNTAWMQHQKRLSNWKNTTAGAGSSQQREMYTKATFQYAQNTAEVQQQKHLLTEKAPRRVRKAVTRAHTRTRTLTLLL